MTNETPITGEGTIQPTQQTPPTSTNSGQIQPPTQTTPAAPQNVISTASYTSANDSIIAQLQEQNAALMARNEQLNAQVIKMINEGAQLNNAQQTQQPTQPTQPAYPTQAQQLQNLGMQMQPENQFNPHSLSSLPDLSLEGLAGEIGKDRPKH